MKNAKLKIHQVNIDELKPASYNPRHWSDQAIKNLTENIKKFGIVSPLLANSAPNRKNILISGHFRLKILKDLDYKTVPVVYANIPDIKIEKEINLRMNKNVGEFDLELLQSLDIDLLLDVGFEDEDLSSIWDNQVDLESDHFDCSKEIKKIKKTKVKPGDLFRLGNNKLICANSTDPASIKKLLGKEKTSLVVSDPPFNLNVNYQKGIGGKRNYTNQALDDNLPDAEYEKFLRASLQNALTACKPDAHLAYFCDSSYVGLLQKLYAELGINYKRTLIWVKGKFNPTPQVSFNKCYEPAVYGTIGRPYVSDQLKNLTEVMNKEVESGNRMIDSILDIFDILLAKRVSGQSMEHPTQKPIDLYEKILKRCSKPGDIVVDLFAGSGSLLLACEQLNRKAYVIDQDPIFCQLILNRWKKLTNKNYEQIN